MILDPTQDPEQDNPVTRASYPYARASLANSGATKAKCNGLAPTGETPALPSFTTKVDRDGIAWLTFDMPRSSVNVFNEATLSELDEQLEGIEHNTSIHALIVASAKDKVFIAGADLKAIRAMSPERSAGIIELGQSVMSRLAALPMPKVAAIHGACVGGGYELALACDARVASDDDCTRVGLPETQLGLLPAWGGSTRLPRLIGLMKALDVILAGKVMKATQAKRMGMVDEVVPREHLLGFARKLALGMESARALHFVQHLWPLPRLIAMKAERDLLAKTRGLYQAPLLALDVVTRGIGLSVEASLELERESMTALMRTPETAKLIDLFFAKEAASKKPWPVGHSMPIHEVAVIGAGVMGAGIAQWLASKGMHVTLCDINSDAVGKGMERVRKLVEDGVKHRVLAKREARETLDRIVPAHTLVPLHRVQLIIEAATEDMALKKKIFAGLAARCSAETILATNTSALSVAELASTVPHPERVIGLHFFNPVHRMGLVEVITLPETAADVTATAHGWVQSIGKTPVVVKDSPGFVVNRVLMPYLMDAVKLFEQGQSPALIDEAMLDFGMPMGPMRLLDEIGLDVAVHVGGTLVKAFPERMAESALLSTMVAKGWLGKKAGRGFYDHASKDTPPNADAMALRESAAEPMSSDELRARLAAKLSTESKRCLDEGVAASARDINLAMVLGTGYAPFRGGPLG